MYTSKLPVAPPRVIFGYKKDTHNVPVASKTPVDFTTRGFNMRVSTHFYEELWPVEVFETTKSEYVHHFEQPDIGVKNVLSSVW